MAGKAGTLEVLAQQVGLALQPLEQELASGNIIQLFASLGLQFPPNLLQPNFVTALNAGGTAAGQLPGTLAQLASDIAADNEAGILQDGVQLIQQISAVINALQQIGTELNNIAQIPGSLPGMVALEVETFAQNLPSRLLSYLLISYLESIEPGVVGVGNLLGFIDYIPNPGVTGDPTHPPFVLKQLQLSRLGDLFTKPQQLLQNVYQWGTTGFDATQLMPRLSTSLSLLGTSAQVVDGPPLSVTSTFVNFQLNPASTPPGLTATTIEDLPGGIDLTLPLSDIWSVHVTVTATLSGGLQATITPPANLTLHPQRR